MKPDYLYEAWEYNVTVDATHAGAILVSEDGGSAVPITLDAGDYLPGELRTELATKLNAAAGLSGTYTVERAVPTASWGRPKQGLRISATGLTSLEVQVFSGATPTRPAPEDFLGWGQGGRTVTGVTNGSALVCDSPFCTAGVWVPLRQRRTYEPDEELIGFTATPYTERADSYVLDYGTRDLRLVSYTYLRSENLFVGRAAIDGYDSGGELAPGDLGNAMQWMWRRLVRLETVKVKVYSPNTDLDALPFATEEVRLAALSSPKFSDLYSRRRLAGEWYDVDLPLVVLDSDYDY